MVELSFSNYIKSDPTAYRLVKMNDPEPSRRINKLRKRLKRKEPVNPNVDTQVETLHNTSSPIIIFDANSSNNSFRAENSNPETSRITLLNGQLSTLWQRKMTGEISPKEYRIRQQELANILHETERQKGHKPIRTKNKHY